MAAPVDNSLPDDGVLVAYLDGELDPDARVALEGRLEGDSALRDRLSHLERGGRAFAEAYAPLLAAAPADRLDAILASLDARPSAPETPQAKPVKAPRPAKPVREKSAREKTAPSTAAPRDRRRDWMLTGIAAAIALFIAGAAAGFIVPLITGMTAPVQVAERPGWRQTVADYMGLMTQETLAIIPESPAVLADELTAVGRKISLDLTPDKLELPHVYLKRAQLFEFRGMPLAQLAYLSRDDGPIAFCIIANGRPDAPVAFEQREGFNIVFWTRDGLGYMLIGKASRNTLEAFAGDLAGKVS